MNLSRRQIDLLSKAFKEDPRIGAAYLMGSVLREHFRKESDLEMHLRAMTGFRNIALHEYREIDKEILRVIAMEGWKDLVQFCTALGLRIEP